MSELARSLMKRANAKGSALFHHVSSEMKMGSIDARLETVGTSKSQWRKLQGFKEVVVSRSEFNLDIL